jgi:hypothetical protein
MIQTREIQTASIAQENAPDSVIVRTKPNRRVYKEVSSNESSMLCSTVDFNNIP